MSAAGRKLFLGGLTKSTTTDMLFETFSQFGQVVDAVVMEKNGHPRGFGFVTFKDKATITEVLAAGVTIDGREVDLKRAVPEEDMVFCPTKVFVGGLSQTVDKAALKQHFEAYGEVKDAVVMIDRATSRSRGFGFVRFATSEGVEAALATPHLLDGQWIDVKRAQPADTLPDPKSSRAKDEEKPSEPRTTFQPRPQAAEFHPQPSFPQFTPPSAELQAYMAGMAQSYAAMAQGFNPMAMGMFGGMGFCPQPYPQMPMPASTDIPALLASMGLEEQSSQKPPPALKAQAQAPKKEVKKEAPKRAELGALSFNVKAQPTEAPIRPPPGLPAPAAPFLDVSPAAVFQDVSNIQSLSSPIKSPHRRASPAIPEQENPQVA
jgi:RNA recognition motif-containing protein